MVDRLVILEERDRLAKIEHMQKNKICNLIRKEKMNLNAIQETKMEEITDGLC